jgi:LPXTG-site transpeptidase (sortase) family protein
MTDSDNDSTPDSRSHPGQNPAADLIRKKIGSLYEKEPDALDEIEESLEPHPELSKHQIYMRQLSTSGRSLEDIQTSWHQYYSSLSDAEKHQVWQEFYDEHKRQSKIEKQVDILETTNPENDAVIIPDQSISLSNSDDKPQVHSVADTTPRGSSKPHIPRTVGDVKTQLLSKASSRASVKLRAKQQFQSLLFGVASGLVVVVILLFGFFNDRFIAPFITPSKNVSSTPIIIDGSTSSSDKLPKIIIPKINVEIPVVYDEPSIEEHAMQNALERGVVHYATTPNPGEKGNAVIFGHSSNNILNKGKYKFAFVLLSKLEVGDTFYVTKDGVRYGYRIFEKKIVKPTELGVLDSTAKPSTVTLITCDPPGTSLNRLIVIGEQISPDPASNKASSVTAPSTKATIIPSNSQSLWQRITSWF